MTNDMNFPIEAQHLSLEHLKMLREGSAISEEVIAARGYRTITRADELEALGFARAQCRVPGLLLPVHCTDGSNGLFVYRPDNPRETWSSKGPDYKHKILKYEIRKGAGVRLDCPPICRQHLANPRVPLWITEGQKKADALTSRGECAIALLGVWNWKGKNSFGGTTLLNDFDYIAFEGRQVRIVFDSDVMTKPEVRQALDRLKEHLERKKAHVSVVYLPKKENGKNGVDDYLAAGHTIENLLALLEAPRPLPQPAAPMVELLDVAPVEMRRPLALIDGQAYAATWPYVKVTVTEGTDKQGNVIRYNPPLSKNDQRLFIIRSDGEIFGDGSGCQSFEGLGLHVCLPEIPQRPKLWSTPGVKAYRSGKRPDPCDVFTRVGAVVDHFVDFDRSLADQFTMAEMVACYILSTWFLDAFDVIGFLWPNGERGSGKTQLLIIVSELAYLGLMVLAGGSFASLRDLADYGATIAFDDAENLADPKHTDPDKRALLLAGNRRGSLVPLKESGPDKAWRTRYVNTFCPRLFSAIRLPDPVLASRTIVVPLVRTPDPRRANSQPLNHETWPFDRQALVDDLWALALSNLPDLRRYDSLVGERADLMGRNLEPWRPLLAVALWLEEQGYEGLWDRMQGLSKKYQEERTELEVNDLTVLVIRALCRCAVSDVCSISDVNTETPQEWELKTAKITDTAKDLAVEFEMDIDPERITSRRVGRTLGSLRLAKSREKGRGTRGWRVTQSDLQRLAKSYGMALPPLLANINTTATPGSS